jgi:superfamily II DNA/RNA helicase
MDQEAKLCTSFEEIQLRETTLRGVYAYGWEKPSNIQQQALVPMLSGRDMVLQACAGSGKTGVFAIGAIEKVKPDVKAPQVLIISPTRELSVQTYNIICKLGAYAGISVAMHRGCGNKNRIDEKLSGVERASGYMSYGEADKYREQIVVATPGRLLDIMRRRQLNISTIKLLILDEADELLSPANEFQTTIRDILGFIPTTKTYQTIVVSATLPNDVMSLVSQITNNPIKILVKNEELPLDGIKQYYVVLDQEEDKLLCLIDIYSNISIQQSIIFVNRKDKIDYIYEKMKEQGFTVSCIHGTMSQAERDSIMDSFRRGVTRVLIATDLLARGIDVQSVSTVFNYDLPNNKENYIHRIGRSGRYGRKGIAINFVLEPSGNKPKSIHELENFYGCNILPLPQLETLTGY